jgi:hypothetical protein
LWICTSISKNKKSKSHLVFCLTPSELVTERASFCIAAKSEHLESLETFILPMLAIGTPVKEFLFRRHHVMNQVSWTIWLQFFAVPNKNLTPNPTRQESSTTNLEDENVRGTENGMFAVEGGPRPYKLSNKSFLFGGSIRRNNPPTSQQPAFSKDSTLGKFGVQGRSRNGGINFDCIFYFVIHLEFERVQCRDVKLHSTSDHKNTATSSRIHTVQVAPSWLGFEASNPLESLLLHCSNSCSQLTSEMQLRQRHHFFLSSTPSYRNSKPHRRFKSIEFEAQENCNCSVSI